jgi:polygalacturonase
VNKGIIMSIRSFIALIFITVASATAQTEATVAYGWAGLASITQRLIAPTFRDTDFSVQKFGAVADGRTDCTRAFAKAIDACHAKGGGRVIVAPGVYSVGAIHLKSNVNLHLMKGAILRFSTDPGKYLPAVFTRWEGVECMNYSALIYAFEQENIAVTGEGLLDGQASVQNWWSWKGGATAVNANPAQTQSAARSRLLAMAEQNVPVSERVMGNGSYLRPNFLQTYRCKNVLIEGVTFKDSPMWFLHPTLSQNVIIRGVTVEGSGPNNDGCDPESCTDVLIERCTFNTGDDCIAIKSGRNADGRRVNVPTQNVIIRGCSMKDGHGGVVIGSEVSGGVRNVFAERCTMSSPHLDRALRIKTNAQRGGVLENIYMRGITVGEVKEAAIKIDFYYEEGDSGAFTPVVRNVQVSDLTCAKCGFGIWIRAYTRSPATEVSIVDCTFENVAEPSVMENVKNMSLINVHTSYAGAGK